MENLSPEAIAKLRDVFNEMKISRRHLRPILMDIAASIEKGLFIDAGSEEVTELLEKILQAQEQFSEVEQIKRAVNSRNLDQVEKSISSLEQNCRRDEIYSTLEKIATLEVDSEDQGVLDALKKVKNQADHIKRRAGKWDIAHFAKETEKFLLLVEVVENIENFSSETYMKVANSFSDNLLITMALANKLIHFPRQAQAETFSEEVIEMEEDKPIEPQKTSSIEPNNHRIRAVNSKFEQIKPNKFVLGLEEDSLTIDRANSKKQLTLKSFNNKLHEFLDSVDPVQLFKILIRTRIMYKDAPQGLNLYKSFPKKLAALAPTLLERLFNWGVVDKIKWRDREFYFLNTVGLDISVRAFTRNPSTIASENYSNTLQSSMKLSLMFLSEKLIGANYNLTFAHSTSMPVARAEKTSRSQTKQVVFLFSLIFLGENWKYAFAKFRMMIERELDANVEVKAVFLFGWTKDDLNWLKMFDTVRFKKIPFFMYTLDGLFNMEGEKISFADWGNICEMEKILPDLPDKAPSAKEPNSPLKEIQKLVEKKSVDLPTAEKKVVAEVVEESIEVETVEEDFEEPKVVEKKPAPVYKKPEPVYKKPEPDYKKNVDPSTFVLVEPKTPADLVKLDSLSAVTGLFNLKHFGRAMLMLHALSDYISRTEPDSENWAEYLAREIGFILDDPITAKQLSNFDTFKFWTGAIEIPKANIANAFDYLNLAAIIKSFYSPADATSFQIQKSWKQINEDKSNSALKSCPAAKTLISIFNNFTEKTHRAFSQCLSNIEIDTEDKLKDALARLRNVENMADSVLRGEVNHRRVKDLIRQIFNYNGLVRKYLNVNNVSTAEIFNFCQQFEEDNLDKIVSDGNATIGEEIFSKDAIDAFVDEVWRNPNVHLVHGQNEPFKGPKRKKVVEVVTKILVELANYVQAKKMFSAAQKDSGQVAPANKALEVLLELEKQFRRTLKKPNLGHTVFSIFLDNLSSSLRGKNISIDYKECLLGAKYIELQDNLPALNDFGIAEFSLKNRAEDFENEIAQNSLEKNLQMAYETALKNYDCGVLENLSKNFLPQLKISEEDLKRKLNGLERQVDRQIERICNDFLNDLELARNYSRITDQEKIDFYINAAIAAKKHFLQTKNAGIYQRFVDACNSSIKNVSIPQKNALTARLEKLEEKFETELDEGETLETRYPILAEVRRQIELMNLTVAEDYMNRLESDGGSFLTELDVTDSNLHTLEDFLSEYEVLLRAVNNSNGSVEGAFKQRLTRTSRVNRETQNAIDFTHGWQGIHSGQNAAIETSIIEILKHLGFSGAKISAQNVDSMNQKSYTVTFTESVKARESYPHPFAVFGTEIYSKGLEIIYLGSNRKFENVAQVLSEMTVDRGTICFMDQALTLPERRSLAKIMKLTPNYKNVIVIDKVMALYLARFDDANRGKRMLQTALPFARVQPYTSGGFVAPEMFIGRSEELDQIRDMSGPVFVYGGRQLGKSALLRQVKSIEHNPTQLNYAFFIDLKNLNSEGTLKKIVYELQNAKLLGAVETWQEFSFEMHKLLDGQLRGVYKPKKLLLLMDESDTFLSEKDSEKAIDILRELLVAFSGQFKFVLAGLHKVIRFEQNSGFGNLNHISVLPFKPSDAMELMVKPMSYLGFKIVNDSLISAIFSRTNYYPGSIQYYCKMLVDAVGNNYKNQKFDVTKNPPYLLDDDYLKNMLGNREFQEEIDQKFQITLHLDDDNYYEILALAVAWSYYDHNGPVGVEVSEIHDTCDMCSVDKIADLSDAELLSLLDEMVALNILRRTDGKFEFNRYAFWHMMGTESEVEKKLLAYGKKG